MQAGMTQRQMLYCYNAIYLAQRQIENSVKEFCKDRQSCRRVLISKYFDSQVSTQVHDCCHICDKTSSSILKAKGDVRILSLTKKQQMVDILHACTLNDISRDCQNHMNEHVITDTFQYVQTIEEISKYFKQPNNIAESIYAIKRHVLSLH